MEICGSLGIPLAMVPCFHQSKVYIKSKLRVWTVQTCIPFVGGKPYLPVRDCKRPRLKSASIGPRTEICGNPGLPFTMVPCFHQSNVYIKRKLQVWRVQKYIPLVGAKTSLTCVGLQTTPSQAGQ